MESPCTPVLESHPNDVSQKNQESQAVPIGFGATSKFGMLSRCWNALSKNQVPQEQDLRHLFMSIDRNRTNELLTTYPHLNELLVRIIHNDMEFVTLKCITRVCAFPLVIAVWEPAATSKKRAS